MTYEEFKVEMEEYRRNADVDASARKCPQSVLDSLYSLYLRFDESERAMANQVLTEWVLSADEGMRFDALAVISEFKIKQAIPALSELAERIETSRAPGAPYELEKVRNIIADMAAFSDRSS